MGRFQLVLVWLVLFVSRESRVIFCFSSLERQVVCSQEESLGLLRFKHLFPLVDPYDPPLPTLCNNHHHRSASWKEGKDCCLWVGVWCDEEGHVIGLDLSCEGLSGPIPSNNTGLLLLPHLQELNLAFNGFFGSQIPEDITRLGSLTHLNLSQAFFPGVEIVELAKLSQLVLLDLSWNFVNIEDHALRRVVRNMTNLQQLVLDDVNMSSVSIAPLLDQFSSSLRSLSLSGCELKGNLPNNTFQQLPRLEEFYLDNNYNLAGSFPAGAGPTNNGNGNSRIKVLDLHSTGFSGELPDTIGNLRSLEFLDLSLCNFSGSLPASLGNLSQLAYLILSHNKFNGQIPFSLSTVTHLQLLHLFNNSFAGQIPDIFVNLTRLIVVDLSYNNFVGPIPAHMASLPKLTVLILSYNAINGTIPPGILSLPQLRNLQLQGNFLTGPLDEFGSRSLGFVDLSVNKLQGSIPNSIFELVNLSQLHLAFNLFSGSVEFPMSTNLQSLSILDFSSNNLKSVTTAPLFNSTFPVLRNLHLDSCSLTGFPNFTIGSLPSLAFLNLSNNKIHGEIPIWMGEIGKDTLNELDLSHNRLTSAQALPWNKLEFIDLHSNMLEGPIPTPKSYVLQTFIASENRLTGELAHSFCNMSSLSILLLAKNNLSGIIPKYLGNLSSSLVVLNLEMNRLSGIIPDSFGPNCHLRALNLNGNTFEGPIPRSLAKYCTNLHVVDLGNNKIADTFPYWLGILPELHVLVLHSNRFYGRLTDFRSSLSFPNLQVLDISQNNFIGHLPTLFFRDLKAMQNASEGRSVDTLAYTGEQYYVLKITFKGLEHEIESILTIFETLDFSHNNFEGKIPGMVGDLGALIVLDISHNNLTGHIPSSIGNLKQLESLDLSSNKLTGQIPDQLKILTFLEFLNLSYNKLDGPIPQGLQFNTFENNSYIGNAGLCGFPLSKKCSPREEPKSTLEVPEDDSFMDSFGWRAVVIGYGCGVAFGGLVGCVVLLIGQPLWLIGTIENECRRIVKWRIRRDRETKARQPVLFVF